MSQESRSDLTRTALYIGVPILVGASCYYLYATSKSRHSGDSVKSDDDAKTDKSQSLRDKAMSYKVLGNKAFSQKLYSQAIDEYTKAIELGEKIIPSIKFDDLAIFFQNRAACNEALKNYEEVIKDCTRAIEYKKTYAKAYLRRAKAHEQLESFEKAILDSYCANLLDKYQNQSSITLHEEIVKRSSKVKAREAMKSHKYTWPSNQIIQTYFSAFTQDPIKEKLATEQIKSGEQLQSLFDEAMKEENDEDPLSLLIRGSCQSLMGDLDSAKQALDKLLAMDDQQCPPRLKSNAMIKQSAIFITQPGKGELPSNLDEGLKKVHDLLDEATKVDPENPDIYLHKAQAATLSERFEDALRALDKAIELKSDFYSAIAQKLYIEFKLESLTMTSRGQSDKFLRKFKTVLEENPKSQDIAQMYAQVLTELSYFEQADQVLQSIEQMDPNDGNVIVSRALLQLHLGQDSDATAAKLREALEIDPRMMFAYDILGSVELQRGKIDEAINIFGSALNYAQTEAEYERCYSLLDSAKCQKAAEELLGPQI